MFAPPDDIDEISIDAMEFMLEDAVFEQANGADVIAQAGWSLAISIWNAMPLPCNNYLPSPRRNEQCRAVWVDTSGVLGWLKAHI